MNAKREKNWPNFATKFVKDLSVREHLEFFYDLRGLSEVNKREEIDKLLEDLGILDAAEKFVKNLSGGMKRRLSVAISLIGK